MHARVNLGTRTVVVFLLCQSVYADNKPQIDVAVRQHAAAISKAEASHAQAIEKARDAAIGQLVQVAVRATIAKDRATETQAWTAILKLDRSHQLAQQYFKRLGTLDKVLAGIPDTGSRPTIGPPGAITPSASSRLDVASSSFQKWMQEVARLPPEKQVEVVIQKLKEHNPQFDGQEAHAIERGVVAYLKISTDNVLDIAPVRALSGLTTLNCSGSPISIEKGDPQVTSRRLADLSPLSGLKLANFNCEYTRVSDLSPLKGMPLTSLNCLETFVSDLRPLKGMALGSASLMNTRVADLSPLKGMPITGMSINGTRITNLYTLKGMPLTVLYCQNNQPLDLSPLRELPLTHLWCDAETPGDKSILRSIKTLQRINDVAAAEFLMRPTKK